MARASRSLAALGTAAVLGVLMGGCQQGSETASLDPGAPALPATETSKDFGEYVVHFNAIPTDQLTPDIARQYGIVRSRNRVMLNVSIIKKEDGGLGHAVRGSVSASAINLTGQLKNMTFREIAEGTAIYYIGEVAIANEETLVFSIDVTPINESSRFSIRYKRQFFVD